MDQWPFPLFSGKLVWTNGAESSSKVSRKTGYWSMDGSFQKKDKLGRTSQNRESPQLELPVYQPLIVWGVAQLSRDVLQGCCADVFVGGYRPILGSANLLEKEIVS